MEFVKLGDYCTITSSKRIFAEQYVESGIPFYRSKEIIEKQDNKDISEPLFISEEVYSHIKNKFGVPQQGDVLLTSVGTLGIPYVVKPGEVFYFKDGNLTWMKEFSPEMNPKYVYYWFVSKFGRQSLINKSIGSSQGAITIDILKKYKILLPERSLQDSIVSILSAYDELIENNNKRIRVLEQMAENLYKEWFVRFRFPGYENAEFENGIPKGWRYCKTKDVFSICYGKDHKAVGDGNIPVLGSGGIMRYGDRALYSGKSVLIPRKGSISNIMYMNEAFWTVDTMFYTVPLVKHSSEYMWYTLSSVDMEAFNSGASIPSLTTEIIYHLKVLLPEEKILGMFEEKVDLLFAEIKMLKKLNANLSKQRDMLLPRLMSGKLEVEQAAAPQPKTTIITFESFVSKLGMAARGTAMSEADLRAMYQAYLDDDATE